MNYIIESPNEFRVKHRYPQAFQVVHKCRILLPVQEMWIRSLGWEDPLEEEIATHSSTPAWGIPWIEEPGGLQFMRSQSQN